MNAACLWLCRKIPHAGCEDLISIVGVVHSQIEAKSATGKGGGRDMGRLRGGVTFPVTGCMVTVVGWRGELLRSGGIDMVAYVVISWTLDGAIFLVVSNGDITW